VHAILDQVRGARFGWAFVMAGALALAVGCGGGTTSDSSEPEPEAVVADSGPIRIDMDEIFPPAPGRDLVLNNCQTCHVWVPIVILQMDETQWARNASEHRDRVELVSDEDFELMYEYLATTFTPDRPVPELPEALLEAWTSY
jgi:hypothetical protein